MLKFVWLSQMKKLNVMLEFSGNIKLIIRGNNEQKKAAAILYLDC